jgi:hypothetical protein
MNPDSLRFQTKEEKQNFINSVGLLDNSIYDLLRRHIC